MTKAKLKTMKTKKSVSVFISSLTDDQQKQDAKKIVKMISTITSKKPVLWGKTLIGFDTYQYTYASGREGEWFCIGFSPRKGKITFYIMPGYQDFGGLLKQLGPHSIGKCCLHIKKLDDIHIPTLRKILTKGYRDMKKLKK